MTKRKPLGMSMSGWAEQQILDAQREGAFDDLPGQGKPLPGLDGNRDEMWWLKDKLKREKLHLGPATIAMRRKVELWLEALTSLRTEEQVVREATRLNEEITKANATELGPMPPQALIDVQEVCVRWKSLNQS